MSQHEINQIILDEVRALREDVKKLNEFKWRILGACTFISVIISAAGVIIGFMRIK